MLLLADQKPQHINTIAHEGKVVVLTTETDGKIRYTVKQDGFEDSYLNTKEAERTGWEKWQELEFPKEEKDDQSVIDKETAELTDQKGAFILKSRYRTDTETAVAPVQAISALGHIYIFRQSKSNTLLVDRFVLDGMTNKLNRKLEVRFKRSKQKHTPTKNMNKGSNGVLNNIDTLDFRDANGNFFYEPTTELCLVNNLHQGWFSVVLVPTIEDDVHRWHIFAYNSQTQKVELTTIRTSEEGLFEVKDYTIFEEINETLVPRQIPGIIKRTLDISKTTITNGLTATKYDLQQEQQTQSGEMQLLKTATRLMLAIPTDKGAATLNFAIAGDGTLAEINENPDKTILRSKTREILLPLNTLDEIKALADRTPPPQGMITGLAQGTDEDDAEDLVKIATEGQASQLTNGDLVKIMGTSDYQGLYQAETVDENTFDINLGLTQGLGYWEKEEEEEGGLIFDGMITAYEKMADGKLRVTCPYHGLDNGDEVQIAGTENYNDSYPIKKLDDTHFVIERKWATGSAINIKLVSRRRRGIVFDGVDDYIQLSQPLSIFSGSFTVSMWVKVPQNSVRGILLGDYQLPDSINVNFEVFNGKLRFFWNREPDLLGSKDLRDNQWHFISFVRDKENKKIYGYIDGVLDFEHSGEVSDKRAVIAHRIGRDSREGDTHFEGQISDLRIWKVARTAEDIKNNMYLQLRGQEVGLVGYWRLGAIQEGQVVDFSINGQNGTVYGDAYVSAATLNRQLAGGLDAVKYSNDDLFAVSERATYEESFEFKVVSSSAVNLDYLDNADGKNLGTKIFKLSYWGKASRSAEAKQIIAPEQIKQNKFEDLGGGWYRVSGNVTIPDGISMLRSFEIANVQGNWQSLEIRKHRIRLMSESITEFKYIDVVNLTTLADQQASLPSQLSQLELKEKEEVSLELEKRKLEQQLAALDNLENTKTRITEIENEISGLKKDEDKYKAEIDHPFNYWCVIINVDTKNFMEVDETSVVARQTTDSEAIWKSSAWYDAHWRIDCIEGKFYRLQNRQTNNHLRVDGTKVQAKPDYNNYPSLAIVSPMIIQQLWRYSDEWLIEKVDNYYRFENRKNGNTLETDGTDVNARQPYRDGYKDDLWTITSTGQAVNQVAIDSKKDSLATIQNTIKQKKSEMQTLEEVVTDGTTKKSRWNDRLQEIKNQLNLVQTDLNNLNEKILTVLSTTKQTPQTMPQIPKDSKGLVTQGAILGFVNSVTRLNAIETSEGNVQLSYFDNQGRMRQTNYDATADGKNATFEQWIPDAQRSCLNFNDRNSVVKLDKALNLPPDYWSIEAWFVYPLPIPKTTWNTLTQGKDADHHILVRNGKQLGIYLSNDPSQQKFYECGFNIELLSEGWHHLTAVGKGDTTLFYIDGKKVGDTKAKALADAEENLKKTPNDATVKQKLEKLKTATLKVSSDVSSIGNRHLGGMEENFGKVAEVRIWGVAFTDDEIAVNAKTLLSGNEPGLLAYYPFNEATGTVVRDQSGQGNNGTVSGAIWWGCTAPIGKPGNTVMQFDGVNDCITAKNGLMNDLKYFTLEGWVKAIKLEETKISLFGQNDAIEFGISSQKLAVWTKGGCDFFSVDNPYPLKVWHHLAVVGNGSNVIIYLDGIQLKVGGFTTQNYGTSTDPFKIGAGVWSGGSNEPFNGQIAEVRIWKVARTQAEIQGDMYQRLTGKEANLVAYYPLNEIRIEGSEQTVLDLAGNNHGTVTEAIVVEENSLPIASNALLCNEYSSVSLDSNTKRKVAMMRRFFAHPSPNGVTLLPDKRVEALELKWIGNGQFAPTLLGYIEGPPPVPSENLTLEEDYNGATSVELTMSEDVEFNWTRSQDSGLGANAQIFAGSDAEANAGFGFTTKVAKVKAGFKGDIDFSYQFQNESSITSSSSLSMTDKLELRGTPEVTPKFPHLGTRFVPKNIGYALVVSALADVFVTRLARSGKMIGYQVLPVDGIPPDVNTITFLMNPTYTMNGSLDGMTGSSATSERFFKHVPEMRSQYGSLYPASYYRLQEAYDLKRQIEAEDKRRESYFSNFDVRLVDETSLDRNIDSSPAPSTIGVQREDDKPVTQMTDKEKEEAQKLELQKLKDEVGALTKQQQSASQQKQAEIESKIKDQEKRAQATDSFADWQKRMEDLQIRAGKRNIVNTYVWDADGGLHTEAQSFATTVEHTIGGSFTMNAGLGFEGKFGGGGTGVELTTQATVNLTQTMTKTELRSKGFQLNVDLSGLEYKDITDYKDRPILPGEKVDRYRFMSFYLEGSTNHFQDFFNYVVDPEWLASNDEEARALREAQAGKPNKAWRVLHRVTYVERPALMGFGHDVRKLRAAAESSENQRLMDKIGDLEKKNQELEKKLDQILDYLKSKP